MIFSEACRRHTIIVNQSPNRIARMAAKLLAVLSMAALLSGGLAEDLESCGEARYYPSEYTCYADNTLCPMLFGLPSRPCNGACYPGEMYNCDSGHLRILPEASGPFTLTAHGIHPNVDGQLVRACGNYLAIGAGARMCTWCLNAPPQYDCGSYQNKTVLLAGGEMVSTAVRDGAGVWKGHGSKTRMGDGGEEQRAWRADGVLTMFVKGCRSSGGAILVHQPHRRRPHVHRRREGERAGDVAQGAGRHR